MNDCRATIILGPFVDAAQWVNGGGETVILGHIRGSILVNLGQFGSIGEEILFRAALMYLILFRKSYNFQQKQVNSAATTPGFYNIKRGHGGGGAGVIHV